VKSACTTLEPYRIIEYLSELAKIFHNFYTKHRVVSDDARLTDARLLLVECIKITLANGLRLVGISLPKKM
jgi:arginyl-tRNA synthetase